MVNINFLILFLPLLHHSHILQQQYQKRFDDKKPFFNRQN
jgi:hypothetical protein